MKTVEEHTLEPTSRLTIRVSIVEDHDDYRDGLSHIFRLAEGFECIGSYGSVEQAIAEMARPDVVLMDIGLPGKTGIEGVRMVKAKYPGTQIIMFTVFDDDMNIFEAVKAGANGYLLKRTPPVRILQAVEEAMAGGMPMTPYVATQVVAALREHLPSPDGGFDLTMREKEVLRHLVNGCNYQKIADNLFISLDTVRNHVRHIYEKLHVHSKTQAAATALKHKLL